MQLESLNVVAIGGGHGLGRVLSTLSFLEGQLTGIVATTDNGGSTGRLRKRSSTIAWGDLRNCLTQLVDDNSIGSQLFNFRFNGPDELGGHNLGNLILYALGQIQTNPIESIQLVRRLLKIKTPVYPMSEEPTDLMAFCPDGRCSVGELSVDKMPIMPKSLMLAPLVKTPPACVKAIENADLIILGPGSFLTSIIPPLLVRDISNALAKRRGHCVFIENVVAEQSPCVHISLDEKLMWIEKNIGCMPVDSVLAQDESITSQRVKVYHQALSNADTPHHHDKEKLISALSHIVKNISKISLKVVNS
jgi:uncharacterized cofD-like protein